MDTADEVWEITISNWVDEVKREREAAFHTRKAQRRADKERQEAARRSAKTYGNAWRARRGK